MANDGENGLLRKLLYHEYSPLVSQPVALAFLLGAVAWQLVVWYGPAPAPEGAAAKPAAAKAAAPKKKKAAAQLKEAAGGALKAAVAAAASAVPARTRSAGSQKPGTKAHFDREYDTPEVTADVNRPLTPTSAQRAQQQAARSNSDTGVSAWNQQGTTWEQLDRSTWMRDRVPAMMEAQNPESDDEELSEMTEGGSPPRSQFGAADEARLSVSDTWVDGDANVAMVRGRMRAGFDLQIKFAWQTRMGEGGEGELHYAGTAQLDVDDTSDADDYAELAVAVDRENAHPDPVNIVRNRVAKILAARLQATVAAAAALMEREAQQQPKAK